MGILLRSIQIPVAFEIKLFKFGYLNNQTTVLFKVRRHYRMAPRLFHDAVTFRTNVFEVDDDNGDDNDELMLGGILRVLKML